MSKLIKQDKSVQENMAFIKNTVAIGATDDELKMLLYLSKEYDLDPLKKEIYFIKYGGKCTIITSRDGYLKIANLNPNFDGLESDVVYQGDKLSKKADGSLHIEYGPEHLAFDKTKLTGAFCSVFRKDRSKATTIFVSLKDYYKRGAPIWEQYINAMILKVAEAMALKRAFSISGLVTREEIEVKEESELEIPLPVQIASLDDSLITDAQKKAIFAAVQARQLSEEKVKEILYNNYNKALTKELTMQEASNFIAQLNSL